VTLSDVVLSPHQLPCIKAPNAYRSSRAIPACNAFSLCCKHNFVSDLYCRTQDTWRWSVIYNTSLRSIWAEFDHVSNKQTDRIMQCSACIYTHRKHANFAIAFTLHDMSIVSLVQNFTILRWASFVHVSLLSSRIHWPQRGQVSPRLDGREYEDVLLAGTADREASGLLTGRKWCTVYTAV
jgi:hypothetical protein